MDTLGLFSGFDAVSRLASRVFRRSTAREVPGRESVDPLRVSIGTAGDVVVARREGRELATRLGFGCTELPVIAAVISELTRTLLCTAGQGEFLIYVARARDRFGILVEACGSETAAGNEASELVELSRSLAAVRCLVDEFEITSKPGGRTTVRVTKWIR
jgi:anti-sigma regulatory factor (Ser/Thr protein kinase)